MKSLNISAPEPPKLNLVALMDIFTILVFFLMVNSSSVQVLQGKQTVDVPIGSSTEPAADTLTISVINQVLFVGGRSLTKLSDIDLDGETIPALASELKYQANKRQVLTEKEASDGRAVTLIAPQKLQYEILRLVLATCAEEGYRDVALAVDAPKQNTGDDHTVALVMPAIGG